MGIPQIIILILIGIDVLFAINKHGQKQEHGYNIFASVFAAALTLGILLWGGFFNHVGWPQVVILVLNAFVLMVVAAKHGGVRPVYNAYSAVIGKGILIWLLMAGHFFA